MSLFHGFRSFHPILAENGKLKIVVGLNIGHFPFFWLLPFWIWWSHKEGAKAVVYVEVIVLSAISCNFLYDKRLSIAEDPRDAVAVLWSHNALGWVNDQPFYYTILLDLFLEGRKEQLETEWGTVPRFRSLEVLCLRRCFLICACASYSLQKISSTQRHLLNESAVQHLIRIKLANNYVF